MATEWLTAVPPRCVAGAHFFLNGAAMCQCGERTATQIFAAPLSMEGTTADACGDVHKMSARICQRPAGHAASHTDWDAWWGGSISAPWRDFLHMLDELSSLRAALSSSRRALEEARIALDLLDDALPRDVEKAKNMARELLAKRPDSTELARAWDDAVNRMISSEYTKPPAARSPSDQGER